MDNSQRRASYLLLIEPEKKVSFRIEKLRDTIHSEINMIANPFYNPHVTVLDFVQYESYEHRILPLLQKFVSQINPFTLPLTNFGSFVHTLYIQVKPAPRELARIGARKNELKSIARTPVNTPGIHHLTLFKDLSEEMGTAVWEKWKDRRFEDLFLVKEFVFLRRRENQRHYQELARFPLLGKEIRPEFVQGKLFE
ncbi:2'-5' RNA ligase family protein [Leadbetterella sp. DM7]|uniref:2'-5' RNA ligase family protein n=1 Tax=Leadbetterella sp. DM7 TaxID=3235085 RepID=UPI00349E580F